MALYRLLQQEALAPDELDSVVSAYEIARREIELHGSDDPVAEALARRIIAIAGQGERDPVLICVQALKALGVSR